MSAKTAIRIYITFIVIIMALSAYFLIRDIRNGTLFRDRVNFDRMSFFDGKQACDAALVDGCIPNPITIFFKRSQNAEAAGITEQPTQAETTTSAPETQASVQPTKPRFSN